MRHLTTHALIKGSVLTVNAVLVAISLSLLSIPLVRSQTSGTICPTGFALVASGGTTSGTVLSNTTNLVLGTPTNSTYQINKVIIRANGQPIGRAQPTSTYSWTMPWVTGLHPNGTTVLDAEVSFGGTTTLQTCTTQTIGLTLFNPTVSNMVAVAQPGAWEGPMSFSVPFSVTNKLIESSFDVTPYSLYTWNTSIGSISPNNNTAQFSSGGTIGTGSVGVRVRYGGREVLLNIPVTVRSTDAPLPKPTATETTTTTQSPSTPESTVASTSEPLPRLTTIQNNPVIQNCMVSILGEERFNAINSGSARPTLEEIKRSSVCFASSNYILPSNFSPVAPTTIKELPRSQEIKLEKPTNIKKESDSGEKELLKLTGTAKPNSTVFIYIFSDPLVLTTTADENGNWTYVLEDPIEAGDHEVYTVVDRGDGEYERSDPVSFFIETAEAADANPSGLSLRLADEPTPTQSNRSLLLYGAASGLILLLVMVLLVVLIRRRSNKQSPPTPPAAPTTPTVTTPPTISA